MDEQKPGNVISPNGQSNNLPSEEVSLQIPRDPQISQMPAQELPSQAATTITAPPNPEPSPTTVSNTASPAPVQPIQEFSNDAPSIEQTEAVVANGFEQVEVSELNNVPPAGSIAPDAHVAWSASEFIDHAKSMNWYLMLGIVGILGAIGVYFLTKDVISTVVIAVVAILFGVSASRKPRVLPYEINEAGIQIDSKHYSYGEFKSFSVIHNGGPFSSVQLMPLKRFSPPVSMYFSPDDEESIINSLSIYLPYEERKMDATDRLLHKIRF